MRAFINGAAFSALIIGMVCAAGLSVRQTIDPTVEGFYAMCGTWLGAFAAYLLHRATESW